MEIGARVVAGFLVFLFVCGPFVVLPALLYRRWRPRNNRSAGANAAVQAVFWPYIVIALMFSIPWVVHTFAGRAVGVFTVLLSVSPAILWTLLVVGVVRALFFVFAGTETAPSGRMSVGWRDKVSRVGWLLVALAAMFALFETVLLAAS